MTGELPNAGDMAIVIAQCPCGQGNKFLGHVYRVTHIAAPDSRNRCFYCDAPYPLARAAYVNDILCFHHAWLKRIPPLTNDELVDDVITLTDEVTT